MKNILTITLLLLLATLILFGSGVPDTFANFDVAETDDPRNGDDPRPTPPNSKGPGWIAKGCILAVLVVLVVALCQVYSNSITVPTAV